jgi:hypothetical protein
MLRAVKVTMWCLGGHEMAHLTQFQPTGIIHGKLRKTAMMSKLKLIRNLVALSVAMGMAAFGMARYHFILMDTDIRALKKAKLGWAYTFVDARGAKRLKLVLNPGLARAGLKELLDDEGITIGKQTKE